MRINLQLKLKQFSVSIMTELNNLKGSEQLKRNLPSRESSSIIGIVVNTSKGVNPHMSLYLKQSSIHGGTNACVVMLQCGYTDRQNVYAVIHRHESTRPSPRNLLSSNSAILSFASV